MSASPAMSRPTTLWSVLFELHKRLAVWSGDGTPLKEIITALSVERQERGEACYRKLTAEIEHLHQTALPAREPTQQTESLAPLNQRYVDPQQPRLRRGAPLTEMQAGDRRNLMICRAAKVPSGKEADAA